MTVLVRDFVYEVNVLDPDTGGVLPPDVIEQRLWSVVEDVLSREEEPLKVGVMTSDGRDEWCVVSRSSSFRLGSRPAVSLTDTRSF